MPKRANDLARAIRTSRASLGMSQEELAEVLGVRRATVSNWERGSSTPNQGNLDDLARALRITVDGLLDLAKELGGGGAPRAPAVREASQRYVAAAIGRIPPRAYQLVFEYCGKLEAAGVPEDVIDEARRLMSGETFNTLRAGARDDRTEDGWVKDVKAAWVFIRDTLKTKGYEL